MYKWARHRPSCEVGCVRPVHTMQYKASIVIAFYKELGLPEPIPELKFHPNRKWRFDFAWPTHGVALEVEGGVWSGGRHSRGSGFIKDMEKYNTAAQMGWKVLRCVPDDVATCDVAHMIKVALGLAPLNVESKSSGTSHTSSDVLPEPCCKARSRGCRGMP